MENHHAHSHGIETPEEALILLKYMYEHNTEHTAELKELINQFDGEEIAALIRSAAEYYDKGSALLKEALKKAGE